MLIRWAEIYANTEILSPIDRETWQLIADASRIGPSSRVIELASGKGAFATFLATRVGCRVDGYDQNPEFVDYSNNKAMELDYSRSSGSSKLTSDGSRLHLARTT